MTEDPMSALGQLTKPATVLIEKISDAVGGVFKPYQIVRVAKAEAEAERIRAEGQIQVTDLQRRAVHRFLQEEARKQSNIENITQKALPHLKQDSSPQDVQDDWITNFFDKCRIVSDDDMQKLWARVLAGEANSPGTFSRRTVNLMADLDKIDAELFMHLCGFCWKIGDVVPLVYNIEHKVYSRHGISFNTLSHLESLGVVHFSGSMDFSLRGYPKSITASYYGRQVDLVFSNDADNTLAVGNVLQTRAGKELASVCGAEPIDDFFDFIYGRWASQSLVPKRETK